MNERFRAPRRGYDPDVPVDPWQDSPPTAYMTPVDYSSAPPTDPAPYSNPAPYSEPVPFSDPAQYSSPASYASPSSYPTPASYATPASYPPEETWPAESDYGYSRVQASYATSRLNEAPPAPVASARVQGPPPQARPAEPDLTEITQLRGIHPADAPTRGYQEPAKTERPKYPGQVYGPPRHTPPKTRSRRRRWPVAVVAAIAVLLGGFYAFGGPWALDMALPSQRPAAPSPAVTPTPASSPRPTTVSKPAGEVGALAKGLVLINTTLPGGGRAAGTGMVLTPEGRVLTNYHVVRGSDQITVIVATTGQKFTADVVGHDYSRDVALLQLVSASGLETVVLDKDGVKVDDEVTAVGNTQGKGILTATSGTVKALNQTVTIEGDSSGDSSSKIAGMIVSTVAAEPGDSGGPTYDAQGEVIGVTSAGANTNDQSQPSGTTDGSEPITFTIPIATAMSVVDQVLSGQQTPTVRIGPNGFLGVSVGKVSNGLGVVNVTPGSPAEKSGLASGDVITSVNGTTTKTPGDLTKIMQTTDPGDELTITWIAGDGSGTRTETVTVVESPWN